MPEMVARSLSKKKINVDLPDFDMHAEGREFIKKGGELWLNMGQKLRNQ
jgi:hypothetical protein